MKYLYCSNRLQTNHRSYVPSRTDCFYLSFKIFISLIFIAQMISCFEHHHHHHHQQQLKHNHHYNSEHRKSNYFLPETSYTDKLDLYVPTIGQENVVNDAQTRYSWREPTPPLASKIFKRSNNDHYVDANRQPFLHQNQNNDYVILDRQLISPQKVGRHQDAFYESEADLFQPIYNSQSAEPHLVQRDVQSDSALNLLTDTSNPLDIIESGSGAGWPESALFDETSHRHEESTFINNELAPTHSIILPDQMMTPIFAQMPAQIVGDQYDHAPVPARRLPKLVATVGLAWYYTIPSDTFQDEDGDLRQLKSSLIVGKISPNNMGQEDNTRESRLKGQDRYLHWLQYDNSTRTLMGFPTETDAGRHFYTLIVSDRLGLTSNETIEITVRHHQSSRAFTHQFTLAGIKWNIMKYQSMVEALGDIVKRIEEEVYADGPSKYIIVQSYSLSQMPTITTNDPSNNFTSLLTLSWSNSSLSVNRCDLEQVPKFLVDDRNLSSSWSIFNHDGSDLVPSQSLVKALSPEFKPSKISIKLQGICQGADTSFSNQRQSFKTAELKTKTRIGKLKWKLGQPIIYKIPDDIFISSDPKTTFNLSFTLHTIDGINLDQDPKYDYIEFDHETKTVFGLPYDMLQHTGQRELLLTVRDLFTNQVLRETFIIDIESQDLTTINNRAFRMSLYFMTRTSIFGPREQVQSSRRMINALGIEDLNFDPDQESHEFTVINIQKFSTGSSLDNSASLSDPANSWKYQDKIRLVDNNNLKSRLKNSLTNNYAGAEGSSFYKLTWTNETIGYRGDCPVEVIKENILYALERSMIDYVPPHINAKAEDPSTNDSVRFYERLKSYFEPEIDLIHLRFEPLSACIDALEMHDVGNSDIADLSDKASELPPISEQESPVSYVKTSEEPKVKEISPINSDEYWAIVVLIILVVAIIFVVMMLFMGLHTYRINQEKRFELQMKLAQARQNSMYLSSLVLADQVRPGNIVGQHALALPGSAKSMYIEERSGRKPIILDNEKQFLANGNIERSIHKPTTVQLMGQTIHTTPLKSNMTFTLDSIANLQNSNMPTSVGPETMMANGLLIGGQQRSMTLNRRPTNMQNQLICRQASMTHLSQSQSILTVASMAPSTTVVPNSQANIPFVYAPMPSFHES